MTVFSEAPFRSPRTRARAHVVPIVLGGLAAAGAVALVAYLLWPTWGPRGANAPDKLPVSVGGTLFNLPVNAIRMKIQRHSGPQERIDLDFLYPSLEPPGAPKHVTAETVEAAVRSIDRIFLSIAAHHDALSPEQRTTTIYPRYLDQAAAQPADGLTMRMFRSDTPYGSEDLYSAARPALTARCTRDGATPGMCLSERRVGGADLTFRFPRSWLSHWHDVADAMDRLTAQLRGPKG
ncbi:MULTISPECIES: hypothetical protein [unclassified Bradyrhizobium]|uniref:hypothetical protein n=1 Tax=unclassified Bradyrhizobium TaxID=2631580 RepID=UPI00211E58DA|nr:MULTISPECIES: hypothetical protein [unclassified Bradyrhizobium]MDD1532669.1 hypothetical protein [Bradyrhizobium sp. WBOS8]MDD1581581.1 hypothetical protein [Bradyrhizobium sp. WBOS4]UUO49856.1 hypothetical protein DCM78_24870 [Bradyrhizobium sp. WBOS04]UUO58623.1 hypothetical protein DCM80_05150 [Bradyrhizobium sp. WBOS08]